MQNVVAPPKQKSSLVEKETTSTNDGANTSSSNADAKSEKDASSSTDVKPEKNASSSNADAKTEKDASSSNTDAKSDKDANKGEEISENELAHERNEDGSAKGPHIPAGSVAAENQSQEVRDSPKIKDVVGDGSPHAKETRRFVFFSPFNSFWMLIYRMESMCRHILVVECNFYLCFSTFCSSI